MTTAVPDLRAAWAAALAPFAPAPAVVDAAFADVVARHAGPARHYHTLEHVAEVLAVVDDLAGLAPGVTAVRLAAWLHDVVYDPRRADNEAASAAVARDLLPALDVPAAVVGEVARLVELTATHDPAPGDADGAVLADADLAVLGAGADRYRRYREAVRREWAWLPEQRWRAGRRAVLEGFLRRDAIYRTPPARAAYEDTARSNLAAELADLADLG